MSKGTQDLSAETDFLKALGGIALVIAIAAFGSGILAGFLAWNGKLDRKYALKPLLVLGLIPLTLAWLIWMMLLKPAPWLDAQFLRHEVLWKLTYRHFIGLLFCQLGSLAFVAPLLPLFARIKPTEKGIRTRDLSKKVRSFDEVITFFNNPATLPIGISLRTQAVAFLDIIRRIHHVLVVGATGAGKTTLLKNALLHAIRHDQPAVFVDPKGDQASVDGFKAGAIAMGKNPDKIRVFSLTNLHLSAAYNPIKNGSPLEIKDRIMGSLNWSEPYYEAVAARFLTSILPAFEVLGETPTLERVCDLLRHQPSQKALLSEIRKRDTQKAVMIYEDLQALFNEDKNTGIDPRDLMGLESQLRTLHNSELGHLLSFGKDHPNEIDFRSVLENKEIVIFQMNVLGCGDSARRLGRMLLEDLKALSNAIYQEKVKKPAFFPLFIDEFGSFASKEFIEFLKQARGANFGIHLYCQGTEDLDAVSPEFRRQVVSNPMTKIFFRVDDSQGVDELVSTAGTFDAIEQSYQVEGHFLTTKTGMGNMRLTKQMRVEHDVIKQLEKGQAIVIEKSPSREDLIQVHLPEILYDPSVLAAAGPAKLGPVTQGLVQSFASMRGFFSNKSARATQ